MNMTKRLITTYVFVSAAIIAATGFFVGKETWSIMYRHSDRAVGCACAMSGALAWQEWFILGLGGLFTAGLITGAWYFISTLVKTRRFVQRISRGAEKISRMGVETLAFKNGPCEAFTFGFFRPRVAICTHCAVSLPSHELTAMLEHEQHHALNRDPLKFYLVDSLKYVFFFVPLIYTLIRWYRIASELQADEHVKSSEALGSALLKVAGRRTTALIAGASFSSMISVRIERIVNPTSRLRFPCSRIALVGTIMVMTGVIGVFSYGPRPHAVAGVACMRPVAPCRMLPAIDAKTPAYYNF